MKRVGIRLGMRGLELGPGPGFFTCNERDTDQPAHIERFAVEGWMRGGCRS